VAALFDVAAQGGGAANLDRAQHAQLLVRERLRLAIRFAAVPDDVGQLERWPWHRGYFPLRGLNKAARAADATREHRGTILG
jgi:hypothetical protein